MTSHRTAKQSRDRQGAAGNAHSDFPLAYMITFTCYGSHLHWNPAGSVDRYHNQYDTPLLPQNRIRSQMMTDRMRHPSYSLNESQRGLVLEAIQEVCHCRNWLLLAAHVRTNHVHVVVGAEVFPEIIMNTFKAYASRNLNSSGLDHAKAKHWTRHGSTVYLWTRRRLDSAIDYVLHQQGPPMATFPKRS